MGETNRRLIDRTDPHEDNRNIVQKKTHWKAEPLQLNQFVIDSQGELLYNNVEGNDRALQLASWAGDGLSNHP